MENSILSFLDRSVSVYHAVKNVREQLTLAGYTELLECDAWTLAPGGKYFVERGGSAIIAFVYDPSARGFLMAATHADSPSFRVKGESTVRGAYTRLSVERYGGPVLHTWLDRPLSLAGRVMVKEGDALVSRLVHIDRDLCVIPTLAPHLNRQESFAPNVAVDLQPLLAVGTEGGLSALLAQTLGVEESAIVSHDLTLYNRDAARACGLNGELLVAPRIDDLGSTYAALMGLLASDPKGMIPLLAVFNNEEVGSATNEGAASTFLRDVLERVGGERLKAMLATSFLVSADNGHALHPNHPQFSDADNAPTLGSGVMIKVNSNRSYATDGFSEGVFRTLCERAGVPTATYYNRADLRGGSTLGSISDTVVAVPTIDIGLPQLAMHSSNECAALSDVDAMIHAFVAFFSCAYSSRAGRVTL